MVSAEPDNPEGAPGIPLEREATAHLELLGSILGAMAGAGSLDELLDRTTGAIHRQLANLSTTVLQLLPGQELLYARAYLAEQLYNGPLSLPITIGLIGAAARSGRTVIANTAAAHPDFVPTPGWRTGAQLCVPIVTREGVWGVISLESQETDAYPPAFVKIIELAAQQLAIAVENANLIDRTREQAWLLDRRAREQEQILALNSQLHVGMELNTLLQRITDTICATAGFQVVVLNLIDPTADLVRVVAIAGDIGNDDELLNATYPRDTFLGDDPERFRVSRSYFYPAELLNTAGLSGPLVTPQLDERAPHEWQAEDLLLIPLISFRDEVIGYLSVDDPHDRQRPTLAKIQGLEIYASQAAAAIENTRMYVQVADALRELHAAHRLQAELLEQNRRTQAELITATKLAAVGTLAAGVAHEFNNLLAGIQGFAELGHTNQLDDAAEAFEVILKATRRGADIARRLLTFAGRDERTIQPASLAAIADDALRLIERDLLRIGLEVERDYQTTAAVLVDPGQIMQVVLNLLTNARDATPPGGRITVATRATGEWIELMVIDTGAGIAEEHLPHIFEPFMTTKGPLGGGTIGGTGLGLSVSYGIVQAHQGQLFVESALGQGSRFTLRLAPATTPAAPAPAAEEPPAIAPSRILVVDDEPLVRATVGASLRRAGHTVVEAADGVDALAIFAGEVFDLVIADLAMPRMGGTALAQALRARQPGLPILLITGFVDEHVVDRCGAGPTALLLKPFNHEQLRAAAADLLRAGAETSRGDHA